MNIRFRKRKHGDRTFDAGFMLKNGTEFLVDAPWHVGDTVSVMFGATHEQKRALEELGREGMYILDTGSGRLGPPLMAHIPCRVVSRRHAAVWESVGVFQTLGLSVELEAETGLWEDLLAWIVLGERPEWAPTEEQDEG